MNFNKLKTKWFTLLFSMYLAIAIVGLIAFIIDYNFIDLSIYYSLYLIPIVFLVLNNIDLKNKELLDEYLFIIITGAMIGLTIADIKDFINVIKMCGLIPYFISIVFYLLIISMLNYITRMIVNYKIGLKKG
ncbi:MAG: hypothetical protein ACFFDB_00240 [Promethearchaeota archaeon]